MTCFDAESLWWRFVWGKWEMGHGAKAIPMSRPLAAIVAVALHLND